MKHLQVRLLWMQEALREQQFRCEKVATESNLADLFTKNLPAHRHQRLMTALGVRAEDLASG